MLPLDAIYANMKSTGSGCGITAELNGGPTLGRSGRSGRWNRMLANMAGPSWSS